MFQPGAGTAALEVCGTLAFAFELERRLDAMWRTFRRMRPDGRRRWLKPQLVDRASANKSKSFNTSLEESAVVNSIEISKQARADVLASLKRYFDENLDPIGDLPAGLLLNFILEEIGPVIYNKAISDAQARLKQRVTELDGELYAPEFEYWPNVEKKRKKK